jgi:acyl carrier protein
MESAMTILTIIANTLGITPDSIASGALLDEDLGADLLDLMGLACDLEEAFLIEIPDADITSWTTPACITKSVQGLAREAA